MEFALKTLSPRRDKRALSARRIENRCTLRQFQRLEPSERRLLDHRQSGLGVTDFDALIDDYRLSTISARS